MNERDIFLAALDITDPAARRNYLDQACGGNAALRASVEALFASHVGAGDFLKTPLVQPAGSDSASDTAVEKPSDAMGQTIHLSQEHQALNSEDNDTDDNEIPLGFLSPSTKPDSLGRLGHYEVLEVLGKGAFGTVLKAFDEKLHRMVAIKVMSAELASTSPARKRFLREARSAAAIRHDNVVAIHAVEEEPIPYLVMEYIPGQTLQQFLDAHGPLDVNDTLRLSQQMASGLAAAHAQGLIHRDIKPSNILLEDGIQRKVKISDFGLARAADDASLTQSGTIAGTPMYMSPEQAHSHHIDQRSDLFSFGSVLYQMLSGRPPFRASSTLAVLKRVTEDTPRPIQEIIPEVPDWLCTIISKLHSKQPADRYQTANELAELLARCQSELQHAGKVTCVQSSPHALREESRAAKDVDPPNDILRPTASTARSANFTQSVKATSNRPRLIAASIIGTVAIIAILMLNRFKNSPDPTRGGRQPSGTPSEISNSKSQISNTESEISNLKSHISNDPPTDPDRRAAEWVLSIGGTIWIKENGQGRPLGAVGELPQGAFELTVVLVNGNYQKLSDVGLALFQDCKNLTNVTLSYSQVSDAGLAYFNNCKNLTHLELDSSQVSDAGLATFKNCRNLTNLKLLRTGVSDAGLAQFKDCKKLTHLNLQSNPVTDAGLAYFQDCKDLTHLDLSATKVSDNGLAHFKDCKNLTSLSLSGTQVSDAGLAYFKDCPNLTQLTLDGTQITDAGLAHFAECKSLTLLKLDNTQVSDSGLAQFHDCKNLTELSLTSTPVSDLGLAHFSNCKGLTLLCLRWTSVTNAGLAHFRECKNLIRLDLMGTQVSDEGLAHFQNCRGLMYLELADTRLTDASLSVLASLPGLVTLNLSNTRISLHGHEQIKSGLPQTQINWFEPNRGVAESVLALGGAVEIGTPGQAESRPIQVAADLPGDYFQVRRVSLAGVTKPLGNLPEQMSWLRFPEFDQLESVDLSGITGLNYDFLASIHGLQDLSLARGQSRDGSWAILPKLPTLQRLVLDDNSVTGDGLATLENQTALTELTLVNAGLNDAALANLPKLPVLKRLVLDDNYIRGSGLTYLRDRPELIDLSLGCPTLGDLLATNLAELQQVKRLSLAGSGLTDAGIKHLASLTNLESLDLRRTKATAAGIAELQVALPMCQIASDFSDVAGEEAGK